MAKKISAIKDTSKSMVKRDKGLRAAQLDYERMSRLQYSLPDPLYQYDWIRPIITTKPYDALRGATRALSNLDERLTVHPISCVPSTGASSDAASAAILRANEWETALKFTMEAASQRRAAFRSSIIYSSVLYHEIDGLLIHLPTQFKASGSQSILREKAALRFGDWTVRLCNPQTIHVDYSEFMPERVLSVNVKTAQQLVDFYGKNKARKIWNMIKEDPEAAAEEWVEYDYVDLEDRLVWAVKGKTEDNVSDKNGVTLFGPEPWMLDGNGEPVPFLPWVSVAGGTDIDTEPEHQRKPMLYPIRQTEQWAIANITGTILYSKMLATANAPEHIFQGVRPEDIELDHSEPGGRIDLTAQQNYVRVQQYGLDPSIRESFDRLEQSISSATLSEILVSGMPMGGVEAVSGYNLQVQTALASLGDFKELGERFYAQLYEKMLLITHYTGTAIDGYSDKLDRYTIDSEEIFPEMIKISVELTPDVPVDRFQRISSGVQMSNSLPYSPQRILKHLGETDPEGALREWKKWQMELSHFNGLLQRIQKEAANEYEEDVMNAAKGMVEQMMQGMNDQAQAQAGGGGGGTGAESGPLGAPFGEMGAGGGEMANPKIPRLLEGVSGESFNPAMSGTPAIMASPSATFEGSTGQTRGGQELGL